MYMQAYFYSKITFILVVELSLYETNKQIVLYILLVITDPYNRSRK